jgi:putative transposase
LTEWINLETGEVISPVSDRLTKDQIDRSLSCGQLKILALPEHLFIQPPEKAAAIAPRPAELKRAAWRDCYITAAQSLIDGDVFKPYRADFVRNFSAIGLSGLQEDRCRSEGRMKSRRAGQPLEIRMPPRCGETVWGWWKANNSVVRGGSFDNYRASGRRNSRFTDEERELMQQVVDLRLTEERPSIASILDSVQARFRTDNRNKLKSEPTSPQMSIPGYDTVWALIAQLAPMDHKIRTRGMDVAHRDLHTLGQGLKVERVLQRVELDEYTVDLMVFLRLLKLDTLMTQGEKIALGISGEPKRIILSAAIDVFTGAIVSMQIAPASSMNLAVKTIEMIYLDKQSIADAAGAEFDWPMHGHPQTLALDRATINMSDEIYLRLAAAGITNMAVPAGKPFLKPWIERFFATVGKKFLQQFTGRTFGNVVLKGENDPAKRATLTLDEFLRWLVRWIVDVHHTTKPQTIGRAAPLFAWERAVAEVPPLILNDESRLRKAFGDREERLVSRKGLAVQGLQYIAPEIAEWFLNEPERNLEVWWWHKKIGRVEVLLPNGKWVTAYCKDERWADKSYDDLAMFVAAENAEINRGQEVRDNYRVEVDARTAELAGLRGIMPLPPSAEDQAARTKEFTRYMNNPALDPLSVHDLFDDEVAPFYEETPLTENDGGTPPRSPDQFDDGDIME